jgi:outer membrane protein assembly factor BamB/predicted MPP superfamily phosphohydrolase
MKSLFIALLLLVVVHSVNAQSFTFAFLSDTHIGSNNADEDLRRTIRNINADASIAFVVITGDITEFGSDNELLLAKQILDSLNKPWYIIPGNHDSNWSESGSNSFKRIFGAETFSFIHNNYLFLGTASGPNMRMSPGQVPREHIVWLDSLLTHMKDPQMPVVFLNHYPQDSSLNNWYEVTDRLKTRNTQLILCGHGHSNRKLNFEGIPAIMGRSNLRARKETGGFNVVHFSGDSAVFNERNPLTNEQKKWASARLEKINFKANDKKFWRPSFAINEQFPQVKRKWQYQDNSDIGSGTNATNDLIIGTNTNGNIFALKKSNGKKAWEYITGGKIFSTPAIDANHVVAGSTDNFIYCVDAVTGKLKWKFETTKPVVANATIRNGSVFIGSSDGKFRAIDLQTGKLKWEYNEVRDFVVTRPLIHQGKIYFGSWGTEFYALDAETGKLAWKWSNGSASRMLSPAACYPVAINNRIFIVAPDRYMTTLDATTGNVIWRKLDPALRVRESMGVAEDNHLVYAKTMDGFVIGVDPLADSMKVVWRAETQLGYELAPTALVEKEGIVYVPSDDGMVTAVRKSDAQIIWKHKVSNSLVTSILPLGKKSVVVTTMDGKVSYLTF